MQQFQIGETVEVVWLGFGGHELVQGTITDTQSDDLVEVRIERPQQPAMKCAFETWRVKRLNSFGILGDTNAHL